MVIRFTIKHLHSETFSKFLQFGIKFSKANEIYGAPMIPMKCNYFNINEIEAGVYAVIDKENIKAGSNAGIIDCGDICVVFDTLLNIEASKELFRKCRKLTGKKPGIVINSHSHLDHFHGNAVFARDAVIITSKLNYDSIAEQEKSYGTRKIPTSQELEYIKAKTLQGNKIERLNAKNEYLFSSCLAVKNNSIKVPTVVFDDKLQINGKSRKIVIENVGKCHSAEDVVLRLVDEKIMFLADVLFVKEHPWLGSGNPITLLNYLKSLKAQAFTKFVPGHGGMGSCEDIESQIEYIEIIVEYLRNKKNTSKQLRLEDLPKKFSKWDPLCFQWNLDNIREDNLVIAST